MRRGYKIFLPVHIMNTTNDYISTFSQDLFTKVLIQVGMSLARERTLDIAGSANFFVSSNNKIHLTT